MRHTEFKMELKGMFGTYLNGADIIIIIIMSLNLPIFVTCKVLLRQEVTSGVGVALVEMGQAGH